MPSVKLSEALKEAIAHMSPKEKNKLLFRLVAKDSALVEKLTFELLETEADAKENRREDLYRDINRKLEEYRNYYYSPGYLLLELRSISGDINRHVKTTKDKYGEVVLNLFMLNKSLSLFSDKINRAKPHKQGTLSVYVVKRAVKILKLIERMHSDICLDFEDDLIELGQWISKSRIMKNNAPHEGLDIDRLLQPHL
ncbi:MAG: hypothetical protein AAGI49_13425 [Bacteroidota bacterium]